MIETSKSYPAAFPFEAAAARKRTAAQKLLDRAAQLNAEAEALDEAATKRRETLEAASA